MIASTLHAKHLNSDSSAFPHPWPILEGGGRVQRMNEVTIVPGFSPALVSISADFSVVGWAK